MTSFSSKNNNDKQSFQLHKIALSFTSLLLLAGSAHASDTADRTEVASAFAPASFSRTYSRNVERNRSKDTSSRVSRSESVSASVANNETQFTWSGTGEGYARLRFTQSGKEVTLLRQIEGIEGRNGVRLAKVISRRMADGRLGNDYMLFEGFTTDQPVKVQVSTSGTRSGDFSPLGETEIVPVVHHFDGGVYGIKNKEVSLTAALPGQVQIGDTVEVSGTVQTPGGLRAEAYVISPKGFPEQVALETSGNPVSGSHGLRIEAGQTFRLSFKAEMEGPYVVEVNNYEGIAAVNQPVYVGSGLPLIPNTLDAQASPSPGAPVDASGIRERWIALINRDRAAYGLNPVELDEQLAKAAQAHIDDMVSRNYFSHNGLDGSTPTVRAQRVGVEANTMVGENLGQGMGVEDMEAQLMASAAHRGNLLNPNWKRVGLGVGRYPNGLLVGAQEMGATAGEYTLSPEYFAGIKLDGQLPSKIGTDEKITVSGQVTRSAQSVQVFFLDPKSGRSVMFQPTVDRGGRFQCSIRFSRQQAGSYTMGISLNGAPSNAAAVVVGA